MRTRILTTAELRPLEAAHADAKLPLMERAGIAAAQLALQRFGPCRTLVCSGPGNNGGDGFVMARELARAGANVSILFSADPARLPADAALAYASCRTAGADFCTVVPAGNYGLVVDALFGIGLARPIDGDYAELIDRINRFAGPVMALDVPSGLDADTGLVRNIAVNADLTASFIALKPGLLTADGPDHCGEIVACDLGIDFGNIGGQCITPNLFSASLLPRKRNSHKGSFGSVAILGGAPGMAGAALLAGRAALKLGTGRVYLGMLETIPVDTDQPELMLRAPGDALQQATVIAVGPGLGGSVEAGEWLARAINTPLPLVVDADGLNLIAQVSLLQRMIAVRPAPTFLTPHPAEAARLLGTTTAQIQADRLSAARILARRFNALVALKGCGTIVATPEGQWFINRSGNPGLAAAGSGDVLTGMLAALIAQHWLPLAAMLGAVHLHGAAADACVSVGIGPVGLTAGELIDTARATFNDWINHHGLTADTRR